MCCFKTASSWKNVGDVETSCNCVTMRYSWATILRFFTQFFSVLAISMPLVVVRFLSSSIKFQLYVPSALWDRSESLIFCFYFRTFLTIVYSYLAMSRPLGRVEMFNEIYVFLVFWASSLCKIWYFFYYRMFIAIV